jgi:hypothetical protein
VELHKAVRAGVDAGRKPDEIKAALDLPEPAQRWVGDWLADQVNEVYRQVTASRP